MSSIDSGLPQVYNEIKTDNYLSNCYNHLTKIKSIHFIFLLIETFLNILLELETLVRSYKLYFDNSNKPEINFVTFITIKFDKLNNMIKLIIIFVFILIFDSAFIIIKTKNYKVRNIFIGIIINILEIVIFRTSLLIFLNLFCTIKKELFVIGCVFLIYHIFLILTNFLNNHLYYFVPEFIDYPYDGFTSLYDIILVVNKSLISVAGTTNNEGLGKFCFILTLMVQIFFHFIYLMNQHSYLFMKNSFLNLSRVSLFFTQTFIIIIGILFGKEEIKTVLFLLICICIFIINILYVNFIYNPFSNIIIQRETPFENILFYLYIISEKIDFNFVFENKINEHYEKCGICELCNKYIKYINRLKQKHVVIDEEKQKLINDDCQKNSDNYQDKLMDLFDVVYDAKIKYFKLIRKLVLDYKNYEKDCFVKNSFYFINLSFLIYSERQNGNINLSLNARIILEVINKENISFLDNNESQIIQIFLCNNFISLCKNIITLLKDILNSEANFHKAKKLIELSDQLKELKDPMFKSFIFSHKLENISNSRHLILICSIIYEEIFNTTLNNSQLPLRDNLQPLEDIFLNHSNKINKIVSFLLNLTNKTCTIIRAGKGLSSYINKNLFDLFPLIFKQYQIDLFMSSILEHFDIGKNENNNNTKGILKNKNSNRKLKGGLKSMNNNKNKKDFIEIKLILWENIDSKVYFKLLTLKLSPLFNNTTPYFILFDGFYMIQKNTIITL